jgi:hypothetical protein
MSATGYYRRVENTTVSGSALYSALSGDNMRLLQFDAALKQPSVVNVSGTTVSLTPNQLIQASISSLPILCTTTDGTISVGTDSASQAAAYIAMFDIKTTSDVRLLRFVTTADQGVGIEASLANSSGTSSRVGISHNGGAAANTKILFDGDNTVGAALSGVAGSERIVLLTASSLTSGSQVVNFNILTQSL